jgi:hypothetical protein
MFYRDKKLNKGLSSIVVGLILILLSLVAIGVVWFVVNSIVESAGDQIGLSEMFLSLNLKIKKVKINSENATVSVQRQVGQGNVAGLIFLFSDGETEESLRKDVVMNVLDTKTFYFNFESIENTSLIKKVSIAPIVEYSGKKEIGNIVDTYVISSDSFQEEEIIEVIEEEPEEPEEEEEEETSNCTITGCPSDWICGANGQCTPSSIPPECTQPEDCPDFYDCIDNHCTCIATCSDLGYECGVQNVCGNPVDCGTCSFGEYCSSAECIPDVILNTGSIDELFPSEAKLFISSSDIPNRADLLLVSKYISFEGISDGCRIISYHGFIDDPYNINFFELSRSVPELQIGSTYQVWNKTMCGLS